MNAYTGMAEVLQTPVNVEIRGEAGNYALYRNGAPYQVNGAGTARLEDLESLKRHGGNSVRNWTTDNATDFLDRAHQLGLTVSLCLDIERERHGFDYDDPEAVRAQFEFMRQEVMRLRNHPALLTWIIGNELNHDFTNPKVYDAVNEISKMIHQLDPDHPTTTTTAGLSKSLASIINKRAPDLDFLSVQLYGGLFGFQGALSEINYAKPLMMTEWGTIGHWEVDKTEWGAPIELNSHVKAETYRKGFQEVLASLDGRLIGNYVFLWGHKQERTPTWYGMFTPDGGRTEAVDVMQKLWTGSWPENRAPRIQALRLNGKTAPESVTLYSGERYEALVKVTDPESKALVYEWRLMKESDAGQSGGDDEVLPEDLSVLIERTDQAIANVITPKIPGPYRLFVYIYDEAGGSAHANIPFYVTEEKPASKEK